MIDNTDVMKFVHELHEANEHFYEPADAYFRGAPPEVFSNHKLANLLGVDSEDFHENYAAIPVKVMASRMNLSGFSVPKDEVKTALLETIWQNASMHLEFPGFIRDTMKYGDGYLEVALNPDGTADVCPANTRTSRMIYSLEDSRKKEFFGKLGTTQIEVLGKTKTVPMAELKYADRMEYWVHVNPEKEDSWEPYLEEEWVVTDYLEVPAFHFRNETPYGISEHYDAYGAQNQIIKIIANLMGVIDFAGLPERWALLDSTNPSDSSTYGGPGVNSVNDVGEDDYADYGPGGLNLIKAKATGTYEVANVEQFIKSKESALSSMSSLTDTPMRFFADPSGQHPAGDSLRAADLPLRRKIDSRQKTYGLTLAEALTFALNIMQVPQEELVVVRWEPQLVEVDKELLEAAEKKVALGVPQRQILLELGYSETQVDAWGFTEDDVNTSTAQ